MTMLQGDYNARNTQFHCGEFGRIYPDSGRSDHIISCLLGVYGARDNRYVAIRCARRASNIRFPCAYTLPLDPDYGNHDSDHMALPQEGYLGGKEAITVMRQRCRVVMFRLAYEFIGPNKSFQWTFDSDLLSLPLQSIAVKRH